MPGEKSTGNTRFKVAAAVIISMALIFSPTPLLPPHFLAEKIQSFTGLEWKMAYLVAAVGLQVAFFFCIGMLSAITVKPASGWRRRLVQIILVPVIIVLAALIIRSLKMGHLPVWINAVIPIAACVAGVWLGLGLLYKRGILTFFVIVAVLGTTFWALTGAITPGLSRATENQLRLLTTFNKDLPSGDAKFGAILLKAFASAPGDIQYSAIQHNRAAILALGIAIGDERLARFVQLDQRKNLLQQAALLREGTTLRERNDWSRHFCLSAALTVLDNPMVSDAGGLLKEQMDALTGGSGFSFGDFAADRAGVRFALAATYSEEDAKAMQQLLLGEYRVGNFLPPVADLPEHLTTEQFRKKYGSTGSPSYRQQVNIIENRLDSCLVLSPLRSGK